MKYIDAEKLKKLIDEKWKELADKNVKVGGGKWDAEIITYLSVLNLIDSLQQEQPKGNLEYWLEHFGMPKENIDNCITQIAQGYGACRYLEGIQHGAEAVNELAKQEQPEVDLEEFISDFFDKKDAENNGRWSEDDIMEAITQAFELGQHTKYQQDRAEFAKLKAKEWQSGYDEGYAKGLNARKEE